VEKTGKKLGLSLEFIRDNYADLSKPEQGALLTILLESQSAVRQELLNELSDFEVKKIEEAKKHGSKKSD
jgi:hypothetical protein